MRTHGYAIIDDGGHIDVRTVSPHARGAKINWLWVVAHVTVLNGWSDSVIEAMWDKHRGAFRCEPVTIIRGLV